MDRQLPVHAACPHPQRPGRGAADREVGVESAAVRKELIEHYDLEIGGGVGDHAATVWRIGLMGANATPDRVALLLAALKETLGR